MALRYLMDENVDPGYQTEILRRRPDLVVWRVGNAGAPERGTLDPEILCWCEENNFVLVTNNRRSMPVHLVEYLEQGRHIPGIFILSTRVTMGKNIEDLILIAECALEGEYQDQIVNLPAT